MLRKISAAFCISILCGVAQAQTNYFGGSAAFLDYSEDGISEEASLTAIYGRLGTNFNDNFSGEIRAGIGVGDDTVDVLGTDVNVELDHMFGAYVRGGIQVGQAVFPYVIVGYTRGKGTVSASGFGSESETESDASFGLGVDGHLTENLVVNVEYMNYFDKDSAEIDGFSIGLAAYF
jgi:opacity protein-like surface antigen